MCWFYCGALTPRVGGNCRRAKDLWRSRGLPPPFLGGRLCLDVLAENVHHAIEVEARLALHFLSVIKRSVLSFPASYSSHLTNFISSIANVHTF